MMRVDVTSSRLSYRGKGKVACKMGRIYVNGEQMTDVDYLLRNGDRVDHWAHRHEHPVREWITVPGITVAFQIRDLPIRVISETDDLLVVEKPPSLPVHTCGQYAIHTVLGQLRVNENKTGLRVLHRLDRATSGVLLFAKNYETDLEFKTTLKQGEWSKEYICKVDGVFPDEEQICEQPIGPLVISMGIQCVRPDGKEAKSRFRKLWTDGTHSVVQVHIETGRTHQIRVHSQFLGFPIVGDQLYNSTVWGPTKGKNAEYGKSFEELCEDVRNTHKSENWHEKPNPEFELKMERLAADSTVIQPEPVGFHVDSRPEFDEICQKCNVESKKVPENHYQLFLHCLKYQTSKWSFETEIPEWAVQKA
uniref:Pseudouridine synthase n=1 Tax=Caenorhabditis tropicalis TaxID=1561998 RepID=A0A1I7UJL8_9PELO